MTTETSSTEIEIFGNVYHVRGESDSEYLRELAGIVDRQMREIAQQTATVDSGRLAILAALNLADQLCRCRRERDGQRVEIEERVSELTGALAAALEEG